MLPILFGGVLGAAMARRLRPQDGALQASLAVTGLFLGFLASYLLTTMVPTSTKTEEHQLTPYKLAGSPSVLVLEDNEGRAIYEVCLRDSREAAAETCKPATFVLGQDAKYEREYLRGDGVLLTTTSQRDTNSPLAQWWAIPRQEKPVVTRTILAPLESVSVGVNE